MITGEMVTDERVATYLVPVGRLALAAACGAVTGWERQIQEKAAGLRTHMLLAVGACLFCLVTVGMGVTDVTRVVQGLVTGAGFIAGGVIFRRGATVHGLTTAAGMWVMSAVGMAAGIGEYYLAIVTTVVVVFIMRSMRHVERHIGRRNGSNGGEPPAQEV